MVNFSVVDHSRWDDPMLVRALDSAVRKYQEAHGHAVDPQSEEPYPTPFGPGDQETPCLDQLRKDALEYPAKADAAAAQDLSGAEESEVDEGELEDSILAAHLGTEDPKEELEVVHNGAGSLAGTAEGQEGGAEQQPAEEEYTDAQYYEWLNWQASQQGAAAAAENGPPATVVVHHHHYYYPVDASSGNSNQLQPSQPSVQDKPAVPTPAIPAVSHSCAPAGPLANPPSESSDPAGWPLYIPCARGPYQTVPALSRSPWQASGPLFSNFPGLSGRLEAPIGTRGTKFEPTVEIEGGDWGRLMTITAMNEYQGKSLEELRLDDYPLGTQFPPTISGARHDLRRGEERQEGEATEEPSAVTQAGPPSQTLPGAVPAGAAPSRAVPGQESGRTLPEIDPVLQDLLSAYYWMGYQTARYLQSRRD